MMKTFDRIIVIGGWGCPRAWLLTLGRELEDSLGCYSECVKLPGYEQNTDLSYATLLCQWHAELLKQLTMTSKPLIVGWSYGGMLAVELAEVLYEQLGLKAKVVTLAARPCFIDDPHTVFDQASALAFRNRIERNEANGLAYFLRLNSSGLDRAVIQSMKADYRTLANSCRVLLPSLDHLYEMNVLTQWQALKQREQLLDVYFQQDALINEPFDNINSLVLEGGHYSPVMSSSDVVERIIAVL